MASYRVEIAKSAAKDLRGKTFALALALITGTSVFMPRLKADSEKIHVPDSKATSVADYNDPIKTYQTFLEAIKRDDLAAAKACCIISDDNKSGSLDVLVGMWVTFHRFNKIALLNFREETSEYLKEDSDHAESPYLRVDCTDQALDRTISRLADSKFQIDGDRAKLTIQWHEDDGYPNQTFFYTDEARIFRKIEGGWKLEIVPEGTPEALADLFKPGSWGRAFRDGMNLLNAVMVEIESGKLKTWQQVTEELEKRNKVLEQKWTEDHQELNLQKQ